MLISPARPESHIIDPTRLTVSCHPANPYEELANAIIIQAVKDYRTALRKKCSSHKSDDYKIKECEKFFRSEWYRILTKVDGEMLIRKLQEECKYEK